MFSITPLQKRDMWVGVSRFLGGYSTYINDELHVKKEGGKWINTSDWDIDDAEKMLGISLDDVPTQFSPLGGIGRFKDYVLASNALLKLPPHQMWKPEYIANALQECGLRLTNGADLRLNVEHLLSRKIKMDIPQILNGLDRPNAFILVHPAHHPRTERLIDPELFQDEHGFKTSSHSIFYEIIVSSMERNAPIYVRFRDDVYSMLGSQNISPQPSFTLPVDYPVEEIHPSIDKILKDAFQYHQKGNYAEVDRILKSSIHFVHRPLKLDPTDVMRARVDQIRAQIKSQLLSSQQTSIHQKNAYEYSQSPHRKETMELFYAQTEARTFNNIVMDSGFFTMEEKRYFLEAWAHFLEPVWLSEPSDVKEATQQFVVHILDMLKSSAHAAYQQIAKDLKKQGAFKLRPLLVHAIKHAYPTEDNFLNLKLWQNLKTLALAFNSKNIPVIATFQDEKELDSFFSLHLSGDIIEHLQALLATDVQSPNANKPQAPTETALPMSQPKR